MRINGFGITHQLEGRRKERWALVAAGQGNPSNGAPTLMDLRLPTLMDLRLTMGRPLLRRMLSLMVTLTVIPLDHQNGKDRDLYSHKLSLRRKVSSAVSAASTE